MTNIQFILNVQDKRSLTLRLTRSLFKRRHSILIFCEDDKFSSNLSNDLWASKDSFIVNSEENFSEFDRVFLTTFQTDKMDDVLVNCSLKLTNDFSRYLKLYELVSSEEEDKNLARDRFKFYRDCGFRLNTIDESELITL